MALLGGIAAALVATAVVGAFFVCWDRGLRRYGRKADVFAVSAIALLFALVAVAVIASPPY